ncbi:MAG: hypothetical protein ACK42D_02405 [Candidatus Paceibacteria bacterium]
MSTNKLSQTVSIIGVLVLAAILFLVGGYYVSAQWQTPPSSPPGGNTPPPLNVGGVTQTKLGILGANEFRSNRYCDSNGENCSGLSDLAANRIDIGVPGTSIAGGWLKTQTGTNEAYCPSGYVMTGIRASHEKACWTCDYVVRGIGPLCSLACIDQGWTTGSWSGWSAWRETANYSILRMCERTRTRTVSCPDGSCANSCRPLGTDVETKAVAGNNRC